MGLKPRMLSVLIMAYLLLFIIDSFYPTIIGRYITLFALAGIHMISFVELKRGSKYISISLSLIGGALLISNGARPEEWINACLNNAPVICLLITVSLFTIPLYFEPYHEVLYKNLPRYANSSFQFYTMSLGITTILASLLNVASLPFVYNLLQDAASKYRKGALAKALIRGTAINMLWSPAFISVAIALRYTGVDWFAILPSGAMLAITAFLVALCFGAFEFRDARIVSDEVRDENFRLILVKLFLQLVILMAFIALLQYLTQKSALVTVPLVSFSGPLLLSFAFSRFGVYCEKLKEYFTMTLPKSYNEVILFTSFGIFGYALGLSDIRHYIPLAVQYLGVDTSVTLIPLIAFLTAVPCLFGIHPLITISTIAVALPLGSTVLTEIQMAGALLLGYMAYGGLSPFSAVNLVIFSLTKADPVRASICQNFLYVLVVICSATLLLSFVSL